MFDAFVRKDSMIKGIVNKNSNRFYTVTLQMEKGDPIRD